MCGKTENGDVSSLIIKNTYMKFIRRLKFIWKWIKRIKDHYDWDYGYLLDLEYYKICDMAKWWKDNDMGHATTGPKIYAQLCLAKDLLEIITERRDDWYETVEKPESEIPKAKAGELLYWVPRYDWKINRYVNTRNHKRFWKLGPKDLRDDNLYKIELYKMKAWHVYCLLRERYMKDWWD